MRKALQNLFWNQSKLLQNNLFKAQQFSTQILEQLNGFQPIFQKDEQTEYKITRLKEGITIVTEKSQFPSFMDVGILAKVGSKHETKDTSGALYLIQQLMLLEGSNIQSLLKNFEKSYFSGATMQMNYDYDSAYWKAQFLHEDADVILDMMFKMSLIEKNFSFKNASFLQGNINQNPDIDDLILPTAFKKKGLGMPLKGTNVNMKESDFIEFQKTYITPERLIISAANVDDHDKFVDMINNKLQKEYKEFLSRKFKPDQPQIYVGGIERREDNTKQDFSVAVCFQSFPWRHKNMALLNILNTMLGSSSSFSQGGPGKGMHSRTTKNLLNSKFYVESASGINYIFQDTGIFGLKVSGQPSCANDIINSTILELKKLTQPIPAIELQRSKNILYSLINLSLERQMDRLEEVTKNIASFNAIRIHEYKNEIEKVTSDDINKLVKYFLSQPNPTVVLCGNGASNTLPDQTILDTIKL